MPSLNRVSEIWVQSEVATSHCPPSNHQFLPPPFSHTLLASLLLSKTTTPRAKHVGISSLLEACQSRTRARRSPNLHDSSSSSQAKPRACSKGNVFLDSPKSIIIDTSTEKAACHSRMDRSDAVVKKERRGECFPLSAHIIASSLSLSPYLPSENALSD